LWSSRNCLEIIVCRKFDIYEIAWGLETLWVHVGVRLDVGEKIIIFMNVVFQNILQNS
jgi:hypothetical protein